MVFRRKFGVSVAALITACAMMFPVAPGYAVDTLPTMETGPSLVAPVDVGISENSSMSEYELSYYQSEEFIQELAFALKDAMEKNGFAGDSAGVAIQGFSSLGRMSSPSSVASNMTAYAQCVLLAALGLPAAALPKSVYDEIGVALKLKRWEYAARKIIQVTAPLIARGVIRNMGGPWVIIPSITIAAFSCGRDIR